jgi:hypothetical protein
MDVQVDDDYDEVPEDGATTDNPPAELLKTEAPDTAVPEGESRKTQ